MAGRVPFAAVAGCQVGMEPSTHAVLVDPVRFWAKHRSRRTSFVTEQIESGHIVRLKSGGPDLLVLAVLPQGHVHVRWRTLDGGFAQGHITTRALERVRRPQLVLVQAVP